MDLAGIAFELILAAALIYFAPLQALFGIIGLSASQLLFLLPMPLLVGAPMDCIERCADGTVPAVRALRPCPDPAGSGRLKGEQRRGGRR